MVGPPSVITDGGLFVYLRKRKARQGRAIMTTFTSLLRRKPSRAVSWTAGMGLVIIWGLVRLIIFHDILLPLTYVLPLLVSIWTRRRILLWTMAAIFVGMAGLEFILITPNEALPGNREMYVLGSTILGILVAAPAIHLIILLLERLEGALDMQISANDQIRRQSEEIRAGSGEILALNGELNQREDILQKLLDSARMVTPEIAVMADICASALKMFGGSASAVVVYEMRANQLMIMAQSGLGDEQPESWPADHSFTQQVIREGRTAFLPDAALRPDLSILRIPGQEAFRSVLCAPMRIEGLALGAVAVYGTQPTVWTDHQLRLAEWVSAQCGRILETLRMQQALQRQATLIDLSPNSIMVLKRDGEIAFWSKGAQVMYGWTGSEAIGRQLHLLLQTRFPGEKKQVCRQLAQAGVWSGELTHCAKDGREIIVQSTLLAQFDDEGKITELLESDTDITLRKRAEEEVGRHRDHLDELVKARTLELEARTKQLEEEIADRMRAEKEKEKLETQLLQTQKMEALGRFAGGIAHDLNNILYPVIINTEILLEDAEPDSPSREILEQVLQAAYRQRDLIRQILSFSRRRDKQFSPFRAAPLIQETLALLRSSLPSTIEIRSMIDIPLDTVQGDQTQIQQVIMNLCRNAADSIGAKPGIIEVRLAIARMEPVRAPDGIKAGEYLRLTVKDTGSGITPDVMDHIFEPFFTTKDSGKGIGMGLAVVHGIIKDHGGTITVESEEGKGSLFTVYLPMTDAKILTKEPDDGNAHRATAKERILLVDDEELILSSTKNALRRIGYDVSTSNNSKEALDLFAEESDAFDLVITDLTMPGANGLELAARLKDIRSDIPVILCTGFSDTIDEIQAGTMGICRMLRKPAGMSELKVVVREALAKNGA